MADVFNRVQQGVSGTMAADGIGFSFGGTNVAGFITQQLGVNYQQPVNRLYDITSSNVYLVAGRPRGDGNLSCVVGPGALTNAFLLEYGDVCNAAAHTLVLNYGASCSVGTKGTNNALSLTGVVVTGVSDSIRSEDMIISEQLSFMFMSMTR